MSNWSTLVKENEALRAQVSKQTHRAVAAESERDAVLSRAVAAESAVVNALEVMQTHGVPNVDWIEPDTIPIRRLPYQIIAAVEQRDAASAALRRVMEALVHIHEMATEELRVNIIDESSFIWQIQADALAALAESESK